MCHIIQTLTGVNIRPLPPQITEEKQKVRQPHLNALNEFKDNVPFQTRQFILNTFITIWGRTPSEQDPEASKDGVAVLTERNLR